MNIHVISLSGRINEVKYTGCNFRMWPVGRINRVAGFLIRY